MGADLILEYVYVKHKLTHDDKDKPFWNKLRKAYLKRIISLKPKDYADLEINDGLSLDKHAATELVEEMFTTLEKGYRDTAWIRVGDTTVFLTGGMSWGDDPTDSFRTFNNFNVLFPYEYIDDIFEVLK